MTNTPQGRRRARQDRLTKPQGSLGQLEALSIQLAGMTGDPLPRINRPGIFVFAADHGVAARGVSAFPAEVTAQMVLNYERGGAVINVLAREIGATLTVADVGVASELPHDLGVLHRKIRLGNGGLDARAGDDARRGDPGDPNGNGYF